MISEIESSSIIESFVYVVEQELHTLPEHLSSSPVFSGVQVARFLPRPHLYFGKVLNCNLVSEAVTDFTKTTLLFLLTFYL